MTRPENDFHPFLIQRLEAPHEQGGISIDPGLGFTPGVLKVIQEDLFTFAYMGSAEFEWGALPKAFREIQVLLKQKAFCVSQIEVDVTHEFSRVPPKEPDVFGPVRTPVYIIAPKDIEQNVQAFVSAVANGKERRLKASTYFREAVFKNVIEMAYSDEMRNRALGKPVDYIEGFDGRGEKVGGWLDIQNHFFFFIDKEMFESTCQAMELAVPDFAAQPQTAQEPAAAAQPENAPALQM